MASHAGSVNVACPPLPPCLFRLFVYYLLPDARSEKPCSGPATDVALGPGLKCGDVYDTI